MGFFIRVSFVSWTHLMRAMCVRKLKLSYDEIFGLHFSYVCYAFYVVISPFLRIFSCCRRVRRRLSLLLPLAVIHTEFGHFLCDTATRFDDFFSLLFVIALRAIMTMTTMNKTNRTKENVKTAQFSGIKRNIEI